MFVPTSHPHQSDVSNYFEPPTIMSNIISVRTHLLVNELAEMLKKVAPDWLAMAFPISVLPVPGGPNNKSPTNNQ